MKAVELAVRMSADASDPVKAFDQVGDAALQMGDDVDRASRTADDAVSRFDGAAESADALGSKSSQAAGGLGDLGGALSMLPGPLGALGAGMETVAPAIQGVTGAMDLANLALESNAIASARAKAAAIAQAVASKTIAAATKAWTVAQRALNLAMVASPIGLIVAGVALLVAGIILAYKHSETFRNIVQAAMRGVQAAVGWVIDKIDALVGFVRDTLPDAWSHGGDQVVATVGWLKDRVVDYFNLMTLPIRTVIDLVKDLIGWIGKIDFPDFPDLNPFRSVVHPGLGGGSSEPAPPTTVTVNINLTGYGFIGDENTLATAIAGMLARYFTRLGIQVPSWPQVTGLTV